MMRKKTVQQITARELADWLAADRAVLIDVREPDEFRREHIGAALSVPLAEVGRLHASISIPAARKIVFQCQSGGRGDEACRILSDISGDHPAYNLADGIAGWKAAGLPVVGAGQGKAPSIFRQVQMIVGSLVFLSVLAGFLGFTPAFALAGLFGLMLALAGLSGWCGLALLLGRMPWNRAA